jgi:phage-related holin
MYPVVNISDLKNMSEKRYLESNMEKIIIGGMTKILECYYDSGEYLAGKSTTIVYGYNHLKYIVAILNSKLMSFYYQTFYNSMSLSGGFFRIGAPQIKELPIAIASNDIIEKLEEYVTIIISTTNDDEIQKIKRLIDDVVYSVYGLSNEEVSIVENNYKQG